MNSLWTSFINVEMVLAAMKEVIDPELGVNIIDLGLVYHVEIQENRNVHIKLTLTTPGCPLQSLFSKEIECVLWQSFPDMGSVFVELIWTPPWNPSLISPEGRIALGMT